MTDSFLVDTFPKEEKEERKGVVELHLLVVEGKHKQQGASEVLPSHESRHRHQKKTKTGGIVLEVTVVDQNERGEAEQGCHHLLPAKSHHVDGGQEDHQVGHQHCGPHEKPVLAALLSPT